MSAAKTVQPIANSEAQERVQINGVIAVNVMQALGEPADLYQIQVRTLWGNHYRVNVLVGANAACARVAHSYFVAVDKQGGIVASNPEIARAY